MPIYEPGDADDFEVHGSRFRSFVRTERGPSSLCAWQLEVPAGLDGVLHTPDRDEILLVLGGELRVTLGDEDATAGPGAVVHVPAHSEFRVDAGPDGATAWVTTTPGLTAAVGDTRIVPPWAQ